MLAAPLIPLLLGVFLAPFAVVAVWMRHPWIVSVSVLVLASDADVSVGRDSWGQCGARRRRGVSVVRSTRNAIVIGRRPALGLVLGKA